MLYPELDIWETGRPVLRAWIREQSGPRATLKRLRRELPDLRDALEKLPLAIRRFVEREAGTQGPEAARTGVSPMPARPGPAGAPRARETYALVAGGILLLAGVLLIGMRAEPGWLGWVLGAAGLATLWAGRPNPT
jgi:ubiquinone biosynthesis protein